MRICGKPKNYRNIYVPKVASQVTFIYIALFAVQIVLKQLYNGVIKEIMQQS